jgi:hypothetical protein
MYYNLLRFINLPTCTHVTSPIISLSVPPSFSSGGLAGCCLLLFLWQLLLVSLASVLGVTVVLMLFFVGGCGLGVLALVVRVIVGFCLETCPLETANVNTVSVFFSFFLHLGLSGLGFVT